MFCEEKINHRLGQPHCNVLSQATSGSLLSPSLFRPPFLFSDAMKLLTSHAACGTLTIFIHLDLSTSVSINKLYEVDHLTVYNKSVYDPHVPAIVIIEAWVFLLSVLFIAHETLRGSEVVGREVKPFI